MTPRRSRASATAPVSSKDGLFEGVVTPFDGKPKKAKPMSKQTIERRRKAFQRFFDSQATPSLPLPPTP